MRQNSAITHNPILRPDSEVDTSWQTLTHPQLQLTDGEATGSPLCLEKRHRRLAYKRGNERVGRPRIEIFGRPHLTDPTFVDHSNPICQPDCVGKVVRCVQGCDSVSGLDQPKLGSQSLASHVVQTGERLVDEQQARPSHHRPRELNDLLLTGAQLFRAPFEKVGDPGGSGLGLDARCDLRGRKTPDAQRKAHVAAHVHIGKEDVLLEDHCQVPLRRWDLVHPTTVEHHIARFRLLEPGDGTEDGGLPAAGWTEERHRFALFNTKGQGVHYRAFPVGDRDAVEKKRYHTIEYYHSHRGSMGDADQITATTALTNFYVLGPGIPRVTVCRFARMALKVPPKPVRALVITPIVFVGSLLITVLSPALHLLLAIIDLVDRKRWRFTRIVGLGIAFCVVELFGLVMAFVLWLASGFGLWIHTAFFQRLHQLVFETWLELITSAIKTFIGFRFVFPSEKLDSGPLVVLARHAGPGDALLVARALAHDHGRRLRMLGTTKLLWDPFFNHLVNRLPFYFCEPNPEDVDSELEAISHAARTIEEDGAMIVFPEGGNYTPRRKQIAVQRLRSRGLPDWADRAERLRHVLPPRTASTLAALAAAADAHVVVVAHVGLDDLLTLRDIWDSVPINRTVRATLWTGFDGARPTTRTEMVEWLYSQWESVDDWIDQNSTHVFGTRSATYDH